METGGTAASCTLAPAPAPPGCTERRHESFCKLAASLQPPHHKKAKGATIFR